MSEINPPISISFDNSKEPDKFCSSCGKDITNRTTTSWGAMSAITVRFGDLGNQEYAKGQLGEYSIDKEYNICFECFLRALGAKP